MAYGNRCSSGDLRRMRVLIINAFNKNESVVAASITALGSTGHELQSRDLLVEGFTHAMTTAERRAYHEESENLLAEETRTAAAQLAWADALLFLCPVIAHSIPASLKGFLDRVFIPGVAFTFDEQNRLKPKLRHIRRIGLITRTPHQRRDMRKARDGARRAILWTVRMNCALTCRRTYVRLGPEENTASVSAALAHW